MLGMQTAYAKSIISNKLSSILYSIIAGRLYTCYHIVLCKYMNWYTNNNYGFFSSEIIAAFALQYTL